MGKAWLAVAGVLVMAPGWAATPQAAPVAPAAEVDELALQAPEQQIDELDEVQVRGGRLYDRLVRAEDRFFKLYNSLNKEDDFDTNCANMPIDPDSRVEHRFCMPAFFADALSEKVRLSQYCTSLIARDADGNITAQGPCYEAPPVQLIFFSRQDAYVNNVIKVIQDNPQLKEIAVEVETLHRERAELERKFYDIKAKAAVDRKEKNQNRPKIR
ncbi:MAG: hypothetical protein ABIQ86_16965 [Steroidobacteraceae bacterium]